MINFEKKENNLKPGELVQTWIGVNSKKNIYIYIRQDDEDPWLAVLIGPDGLTKVRYIHLEEL